MTHITITQFEDKKTKNDKPFTRFLTSNGKKDVWMSAWDSDVIKTIKDNSGKTFDVEIQESGEYQNIRAVNNIINGSNTVETVKGDVQTSIQASVALKGAIDLVSSKAKEYSELEQTAKDCLKILQNLQNE